MSIIIHALAFPLTYFHFLCVCACFCIVCSMFFYFSTLHLSSFHLLSFPLSSTPFFSHTYYCALSECVSTSIFLACSFSWYAAPYVKLKKWAATLRSHAQHLLIHSLIHSFIRSFTHSLTHSFTHSPPLPLTHSLAVSCAHAYMCIIIAFPLTYFHFLCVCACFYR